MALSDTKLRNLKPGEKSYIESDEGGLHLEVTPGGAKVWRLRYRVGGRGTKQEKITLGNYPTYLLADARTWRDDCKALSVNLLFFMQKFLLLQPMDFWGGLPTDKRQLNLVNELYARSALGWSQHSVV